MGKRNREIQALEELDAQAQRFVEAYLVSWDPVEAGEVVGWDPKDAHQWLSTEIVKKHLRERLQDYQMGADEVIYRISEMARFNPGDFFDVAYQIDNEGNSHPVVSMNWEKIKKKGWLLRKIEPTNYGMKIEGYSALEALGHLAKVLGIEKEHQVRWNVDLSKLSDDQLARLIMGEDPQVVILEGEWRDAGPSDPGSDGAGEAEESGGFTSKEVSSPRSTGDSSVGRGRRNPGIGTSGYGKVSSLLGKASLASPKIPSKQVSDRSED